MQSYRKVRATRAAQVEALESRHLLAGDLVEQQQVIINEIHADPLVKTELVEFIELHNRADVSIDLSGWSLRDGVDFSFPAGTSISPKGYLVVTQNGQMFNQKFGKSAAGEWVGTLNNDGENVELRNAEGTLIDLADYRLGFPWPTYGDASDVSVQLINESLDNELGGSWRSASPTPGEKNSVVVDNAPPLIRQVEHFPRQPRSAIDVTVTAKITDSDGVKAASLEYQIVAPGNYINLKDAEYETSWQSIPMRDDGQSGDRLPNDDIYTVVLPAALQQHRHLVRYRITSSDTQDVSLRVPYADDPQPNFAYFVFDSVPNWTGAVEPGTTPDLTFNFAELQPLPVYHLISKGQDVDDAQYHPGTTLRSGYTGSEYRWSGTLVYGDQVYDHIRYRSRGGVWRYAMGKNMWKFDFNTGHDFQAHDEFGEEYKTKWDKLNFSAIIQQGDFLHRGEHGLFEAVGFKLFNLMDVEASKTHYVHFRVIDDANETGETQYDSDFWGLYLAVEQPDGRMLDEHGLPDGNLYKIEDYRGTSNNQGPTQVSDGSDVRDFIRSYRARTVDDQFWRDNLDLHQSFSYRAVVESIHHYDIAYGKNYFYYHNPETNLFEEIPWDIDLTWANNMYGDGNHDFKRKLHDNPTFAHEYRNRMREYRDLLYNSEQTGLLIDQQAAYIYTPDKPSWVDADRAMWDYNPILRSRQTNPSKAGHGRYYQRAETKDFAGMIQIMKDYVVSRGEWIDERILRDSDQTPLTPTIEYVGQPGFAIDQLMFRTSSYADPQSDPFGAMQWRIAEITDPSTYQGGPAQFEITATWKSDELTEFEDSVTIPADRLQVGHTYRVRVRMKDSSGYWSHWSEPIQFVASASVSPDLANSLRISEIHYNPADPSPSEMAAGFTDATEFEFVEFLNTGSNTIDLRGARFFGDVFYDFSQSQIAQLAPGQRILVVENANAFRMRYGDGLPIAGEWSGRLANGSQTLIVAEHGVTFLRFDIDDDWYPETDGEGRSLEAVDPAATSGNGWSLKTSWRASLNNGGTPGRDSSGNRPGDSNHDGIFNSSDLVLVFQAGEYEDNVAGNSTFAEGDWNGDGEFTSTDMVLAFQLGSYVAAAQSADPSWAIAPAVLMPVTIASGLRNETADASDQRPTVTHDRTLDSLAVRDLIFDEWQRAFWQPNGDRQRIDFQQPAEDSIDKLHGERLATLDSGPARASI
jgi:hypothetical protein